MEIAGSLMLLFVIYSVFIILFHLGRYPPPLVPRGRLRRESAEAAILFVIILFVRWLKASFPSVFTWAVYVIGVYLGIGLCLLIIMEKVVRRRNLSAVGFKLPTNKKILMVFAGLVALQLIGGMVLHLVLEIEFSYLNIYFISGVILGPFFEETMFRGLIQTRLEAGLGSVKSWVLTGLLFGFYHYWAHFLLAGEMLTIPSLTQLVVITLFGMLLGVIFAKTRSLLPAFLVHAANNFVAFS